MAINSGNARRLWGVPVSSTAPTDGQVIAYNDGNSRYEPTDSASAKEYDTIVAPSGGDYTTLGAAISAGKKSIFVKSGTYTETGAITIASDDVTIVGENASTSVVAMGSNNFTNVYANFTLRNITFTTSGGLIYFAGAGSLYDGNTFTGTGTTTVLRLTGSSTFVNNTVQSSAIGNGDAIADIAGSRATIVGNRFLSTSTTATHQVINIYTTMTRSIFNDNIIAIGEIGGNSGTCLTTAATTVDHTMFCDNVLRGSGGTGTTENGFDFSNVGSSSDLQLMGNYISDCDYGIYLPSSAFTYIITGNQMASTKFPVYIDGISHVTVTGNVLHSNSESGSVGITVTGGASEDVTISGNVFHRIATGVSIGSGVDRVIVTGNSFGPQVTTPISDSGGVTTVYANEGTLNTDEKRYVTMTNNSGGSVAAGDLVVYDANANGGFTTTTTGGDDLVCGMAVESINNAAEGHIQIHGKTTSLKVNGTTAIAIGDFITPYTSAGIGQKAAAGDMAIAIALEAYSTADSSGVIDALIITPRKI